MNGRAPQDSRGVNAGLHSGARSNVPAVTTYEALLADLKAEEDALDLLVSELDEPAWAAATPAAGWDVRDTIGHLAVSEDLAGLSTTDPDAFAVELARLVEDMLKGELELVGRARSTPPAGVLAWWREARTATLAGLWAHEAKDRLPWFAGPMSAMSFATARLMETWAHGQDVADALGVDRLPTPRLRHVAEIGVRTRGHAFRNRGLPEPAEPVYVALDAPGGTDRWTWGDDTAADRVTGSAVDFCLVVTQRRHPGDTSLRTEGDAAREWIAIAQAFAGPATDHRDPATGA
jgi:uncharacterized protein (TIGR03084 family)